MEISAMPQVIPGSNPKHPGQPIRQVIRIKERRMVGYPLHVVGLTAEESVRLPEEGLGGRRRMGSGFLAVPILPQASPKHRPDLSVRSPAPIMTISVMPSRVPAHSMESANAPGSIVGQIVQARGLAGRAADFALLTQHTRDVVAAGIALVERVGLTALSRRDWRTTIFHG